MTTIVTKNSSTAASVPSPSDLTQGELAVNVADKKLYTKDNGGSVVELVSTNDFTDAEKTKLTGIEASATADQTAAEILTALLTVDGSGSGLDSDKVDGFNISTASSGTDANTIYFRTI